VGSSGPATSSGIRDEPGIIDAAEAGDGFGGSLAAGDFDGDGRADLAVGVGDEEVDGATFAGAAQVIYGSAGGLTGAGSQFWRQGGSGLSDAAEANDVFARALGAGDFDEDGRDDLAVGIPGEDSSEGAVQVIYGSVGGLTGAGNQLWDQDVSGINDFSRSPDGFGRAVAAGDFNGDGADDLAAGVPNENASPAPFAGAVHVIYGSTSGLVRDGDQLLHQNVPGVDDVAEGSAPFMGDFFGAAVAAGDFNGDGRADLVAGVPQEDLGATSDAGAVQVIYGSAGGFVGWQNQFWHQDVSGIFDDPETDDLFGSAVAAGDFNGDGRADLAAGVPGEDVDGIANMGAVPVLYGSASGLDRPGNQLWHQDVSGIFDDGEIGDSFGSPVAATGRSAPPPL
jgi:FG-GAP repeat